MAWIGSLLIVLTVLECLNVAEGSFFVSTHQKGRYVKPPSGGKRSLTNTPLGDSPGPVELDEIEDTEEKEKEACRWILDTIDRNIDGILRDANGIKDNEEPYQRAMRYVNRNYDLLGLCLSRVGKQ